ncbi:MAG: hypothetical protein Q8928_08480 [Bacteroidota bacterium]|nr:hypothetical protein [Bacteroidota bacterium]
MQVYGQEGKSVVRDRISIDKGWEFFRYETSQQADKLVYDVRPDVNVNIDNRPADARPTDAVQLASDNSVLKSWILPTGNAFIKDPAKRYARPQGNPGADFPFVQSKFDDSSWEDVTLPHDWAIKGPFYKGENVIIGGGMGRLPIQGVAWYRRKLDIPAPDAGKSIFLDVDGAIYRNVWLTKTNPVHVGQRGTFVTSADHKVLKADGKDLTFVTVRVTDKNGLTIPNAKNLLQFSVEGPGEIVATDNGDAASLVSFASTEREAFNGLCLVIIRGKEGSVGKIKLKVHSTGLKDSSFLLNSK